MTKVFAHRGLHQSERENTLAAFGAARAAGADAVELDVRLTRDGALVVHHDPAVEGRVIAHQDRSDLPDWVPTLAEAMAACEGMLVNVEIKNYRHESEPTYDDTGAMARRVLGEITERGWAERCLISCFDLATCVAAREARPEVPVGLLVEPGVDLAHAARQAASAGLAALHPYHRDVDATLVEAARAAGLEINVWTVNRPEDLAAMVALGVDGLITDGPSDALAALGRRPEGGPRPVA